MQEKSETDEATCKEGIRMRMLRRRMKDLSIVVKIDEDASYSFRLERVDGSDDVRLERVKIVRFEGPAI